MEKEEHFTALLYDCNRCVHRSKLDAQPISIEERKKVAVMACDSSNCAISDPSYHSRVLQCDGSNYHRTIGYTLVEPKAPTSTAIVYFYALSGCSSILSHIAQVGGFEGLTCNILCVDRPGCGGTTDLNIRPREHLHGFCGRDTADNIEQSNDYVDRHVHRIQQSARDVLAVLRHLRFQYVYLLSICIGHPYAIQVCRELLSESTRPSIKEQRDNHMNKIDGKAQTSPQLKGVTLVAPFVSTACPDSWWLARFATSIPGAVVSTFVQTTTALLEPMLMPLTLRPSIVRRILSENELADGGWTDNDLQQLCDMLLYIRKVAANSKLTEAELGVSNSWQHSICDKFAKEIGMLVENDGFESGDRESRNQDDIRRDTSTNVPPLRIYASQRDKLANIHSIRWIADRCYGGFEKVVSVEPRIDGHEIMTMLGGPLRNPVLFRKIASEWGLLDKSYTE